MHYLPLRVLQKKGDSSGGNGCSRNESLLGYCHEARRVLPFPR